MKLRLFFFALILLFLVGSEDSYGQRKKRKKNKGNESAFTIDFKKYSKDYPPLKTDSALLLGSGGDSIFIYNDSSFLAGDNTADSILFLMDTLSKMNNRVPFEGYRIVLYTGPDRQKALITKGKAIKLFNDQTAVYYNYERPYFRVKAGNYFDRYSAYPTFVRVKREFPTALLVPEPINVSKVQFE